MDRRKQVVLLVWSLVLCLLMPDLASAQLKKNFYSNACPNVEKIVRKVVKQKIQQTFVTIPATLRLFFHDCIANGCDASIMIQSTPNNKAEKDHPDNLSLAGDGFDTVIKAKAAVDATTSGCKNNVSCADILAIAARDVVNLAGGPFYSVELGRKDSLVSTASSVNGRLPQPNFNLDQLTAMFGKQGLSQADMIALSAAHTLGFSHCDKFSNRIYNFSSRSQNDPTLNSAYASQLRVMCPKGIDPRVAINMDPVTPNTFDNTYYKNLMQGRGLFTSDQVLFTDKRSNPLVVDWAQNSNHFNAAFIKAMTKLGRVGATKKGNIRVQCDAFN